MEKGKVKVVARANRGRPRTGDPMARATKAKIPKVEKEKEKEEERVDLTLMSVETVVVVATGRMSVGFSRRVVCSRWPMMDSSRRRCLPRQRQQFLRPLQVLEHLLSAAGR